jgi:hypothetical protein
MSLENNRPRCHFDRPQIPTVCSGNDPWSPVASNRQVAARTTGRAYGRVKQTKGVDLENVLKTVERYEAHHRLRAFNQRLFLQSVNSSQAKGRSRL